MLFTALAIMADQLAAAHGTVQRERKRRTHEPCKCNACTDRHRSAGAAENDGGEANNTGHQSNTRRDANAAVSRCRIVVRRRRRGCAQTIRSPFSLHALTVMHAARHAWSSLNHRSASSQSSFHGMRLDFRSAPSLLSLSIYISIIHQPTTSIVSHSVQPGDHHHATCMHVVEYLSSMR